LGGAPTQNVNAGSQDPNAQPQPNPTQGIKENMEYFSITFFQKESLVLLVSSVSTLQFPLLATLMIPAV